MLAAGHETFMRDKDNQALMEEIMLLRTRLSHACRDEWALKGEVESLKKEIALLEERNMLEDKLWCATAKLDRKTETHDRTQQPAPPIKPQRPWLWPKPKETLSPGMRA